MSLNLPLSIKLSSRPRLLLKPNLNCSAHPVLIAEVMCWLSSPLEGWTLLQLEVMKDDLEAVFRDVTRGER